MKIPDRLLAKLSRVDRLAGSVLSSLGEFGPWLETNQVVFFEDYTDHSIRHIEQVLVTASALIRDEAWEFFTPEDAYLLILATLLHDVAMHMTRDGFVTLVATRRSSEMVAGFDDLPWDLLWGQFLNDFRHNTSAHSLINVVGTDDTIRKPMLNPYQMDGQALKIIGEFIRRHHHRLAHEIALFGVPGPEGRHLSIRGAGEDSDLVNLAGFVARSHGMPLRLSLAWLKHEYDLRQFQGAHPIFIMVLLRIADYLQVHRERAPQQRLLVAKLRSPTSEEEWALHHSVRSLQPTEDPEAIYVDVMPKSIKIFLKVEKLLRSIQEELDISWAVLGEIYGRYEHEGWSKFGLSLRRVVSSLDDKKKIANRLPFFPHHAAFSFDHGMLQALVSPLYGDHPEIGIRELMQNAIDAVQERDYLVKKHPELSNVNLQEQAEDVVVWLRQEGDRWILTVSDRGIGMTEKTVRDFFLKAGASFRVSAFWRDEFTGSDGRGAVLRSGRFGIGVLASFLLGDEIAVYTRHIREQPENGVSFTANLSTETIELLRVHGPVGTTIRLSLNEAIARKLVENPEKWDWYCLSRPHVLRQIGDKKANQRFVLPGPGEELGENWRRASDPQFEDIHWTYLKAPELTCNGLAVNTEKFRAEYVRWTKMSNIFPLPRLSVFDPDALMPFNIQRDGLHSDYPFAGALMRSLTEDFVAFLLARSPMKAGHPDAFLDAYRLYWRMSARYRSSSAFFSNDQGFAPITPYILRLAGVDSILVIFGGNLPEARAISENLNEKPGKVPVLDYQTSWSEPSPEGNWDLDNMPYSVLRKLITASLGEKNGDIGFFDCKCKGMRIICERGNFSRSFSTKSRVEVGAGWEVFLLGDCPANSMEWDHMLTLLPEAQQFSGVSPSGFSDYTMFSALELYIDYSVEPERQLFDQLWIETLGEPLIRFGEDQRRKQSEALSEKLGDLLKMYMCTS